MAVAYERLSREVNVAGARVPTFFYGTAWKEDGTERLTTQALELGFRAVDTANQRKHYVEAAVGRAVSNAVGRGMVARSALFLQTKFTHVGGQGAELPYDSSAEPGAQVMQSFASSLEHLGTDYLDSYVLHGPVARRGLTAEDRETWQAMSGLERSARVRLLGVSNVTHEQLELFCDGVGTAPAFVQNRCYATTGWDRDVRAVCARHGIRYQAFSLLTANPGVLRDPRVAGIARRLGVTTPVVLFRFALDLGMIPLTGTSSAAHAREDMGVYDLAPLTDAELEMIERILLR